MPCVSSRDQTTCWRLFHPLQGAVPRALSDLHRNPKKQTPEHLPSPFSPIDRRNASKCQRADRHIDTRDQLTDLTGWSPTKRGAREAWTSQTDPSSGADTRTDSALTFENSGTNKHLAPQKCTASPAVLAGGPEQSEPDERTRCPRASGPAAGRSTGA
jgi:hypothetical protein